MSSACPAQAERDPGCSKLCGTHWPQFKAPCLSQEWPEEAMSPNSHGLEGTDTEGGSMTGEGDVAIPATPTPEECGRGGLMSFGRMPAFLIPGTCHLSLPRGS